MRNTRLRALENQARLCGAMARKRPMSTTLR